MMKLIVLELRKNRLKSFHLAVLFCGIALLAMEFFWTAIPYLDPNDGDSALFLSYNFTMGLNHILGTGMFAILGGTLGGKLVVEPYGGKGAFVELTYPVARSKLIGAKLILTFLYAAGAMAVCGFICDGVFFLAGLFLNLSPELLTVNMLPGFFMSLAGHALIAGALSLGAVWIGFVKKSLTAAIVASVILGVVLCQILSSSLSCRAVLGILTGICLLAAGLAVRNLCHRVQVMEV